MVTGSSKEGIIQSLAVCR